MDIVRSKKPVSLVSHDVICDKTLSCEAKYLYTYITCKNDIGDYLYNDAFKNPNDYEKYLEELITNGIVKFARIEDTKNSIVSKETNHIIDFINKNKTFIGIYIFWENDNIVYIGKTIRTPNRIFSSYKERKKESNITHFSTILIKEKADINTIEPCLIAEYHPLLNKEFSTKNNPTMFKSNINLYELERKEI